MLLTLWMTSKIADSAKQREVRQAMQFVSLELRNNQQTIQNYATIYTNEKRIAQYLQKSGFNTSVLPPDTVMHYTQRLFSGLAKPYRFSTDALEMLKTSGLTSHIGGKQQVVDLLHIARYIRLHNGALLQYAEGGTGRLRRSQSPINVSVQSRRFQQTIQPDDGRWQNTKLVMYRAAILRLLVFRTHGKGV